MIRKAELKDTEAMAHVMYTTWQTAFTGIVDPSYVKTLSLQRYTGFMKKNIQQLDFYVAE